MKKCSISFNSAGLTSERDLTSAWVCDFAATAINRSFRSVLPSSLCSASITHNKARFNETTTESGFIHQDECVDRIAIVGHGPGNRAEIKRENRAMRKHAFEDVALPFMSKATLLQHPFGVSMTTFKLPDFESNGGNRLSPVRSRGTSARFHWLPLAMIAASPVPKIKAALEWPYRRRSRFPKEMRWERRVSALR